MTRTRENEDRARQAVAAELAARQRNPSWLVREAGIDPGTLADFLAGHRWPKTATQGRIERALGWAPGTVHAIANGADAPDGPEDDGDELDELVQELREASAEQRKLLRDLLRNMRATG